MSYELSGNLITDKQAIQTLFEWNIQAEWEAYQTKNNIEIDSDVLKLAQTIPAAVTNHWPHNEGSGSTLADAIGSQDMAITGATWISGDGRDGFHLDYDGSNDESLNDNDTYWDSDTFSIAFWVNADILTNFVRVVSASPDTDADSWSIRIHEASTGNFRYEAFLRDNSPTTHKIEMATNVSTGTWYFLAMASNGGGELAFYWGERTDSDLTTAGTTSVSTGFARNPGNLMLGNLSDFELRLNGKMDDVYYAKDTKMPKTDFETIFDNTKGNYS